MTCFIQRKRRIGLAVPKEPPIEKKKFTKACALDALKELFGNNLIGIDVRPIKNGHHARMNSKGSHLISFKFQVSGFRFPVLNLELETLNLKLTYIPTLAHQQSARPPPQRRPLPDLPDASGHHAPAFLQNSDCWSRRSVRPVPGRQDSCRDTPNNQTRATQNRHWEIFDQALRP